MKALADKFFKFRSYTPIPFLILMLIFLDATALTLVSGFLIALLGELIRIWGVNWAGSETRSTGPVGGTYLIIKGPFAHVRNPLYVGNILIYLGLGIMSFAWFPYLQLAALLFFIFQYYFIVRGEEKYLREKYGNLYQDYFENVPSFIPRITPYKNPDIKQPPYKPRAGLRSEKRSLQAVFSISALILIVWAIKNSVV